MVTLISWTGPATTGMEEYISLGIYLPQMSGDVE